MTVIVIRKETLHVHLQIAKFSDFQIKPYLRRIITVF